MDKPVQDLNRLLQGQFPGARVLIDEPAVKGGTYWIDLVVDKRRHTLEYRPGKGFGLFGEEAAYGERPGEIYRTAERAVQRMAQLVKSRKLKRGLGLKEIRQLYGQSQVKLAKRAGVKQPAISRFEKRGEVKLSTLAAAIKALGGELEVRARFSDADLPISLSQGKR